MTVTAAIAEYDLELSSKSVQELIQAVERVVVGQRTMIERLVIGLLTGGHVLLEGVPGLAKTLAVSSLARGIDAPFSRIQFTPDLLPADLIGTLIYHPNTGVFTPRKGPIFANIVLADEINRAPAKVQSALLEAMQERQVTIGDTSYRLAEPFLVLATQNPIEHEGTYPLPEAQIDRFMLKIKVGYPTEAEERIILDHMATNRPDISVAPVVSGEDILSARDIVDRVHVDDSIRDYVVRIVRATRDPRNLVPSVGGDIAKLIEFGASPRATIALVLAGRAHAFLDGRGFVMPADIKAVGHDVLRHRVLASYEAQAENLDSEHVITQIFDHVPVP